MPVVTDTTPAIVLTIEERQEDYAGVSAESQTLRQYPNGSLAAHSLGYVGPVNQDELDAARKAGRTDLNLNAQIGRAGLEKTYDADLRGTDGVRYVTVDNRGTLIGTQRETEPERGDTLVTSIDRDVQRIAEQALTAEITKRRTERDKDGQLYAAPSGAAVVLDPRNGRVIALASTPTYDPTVFVGGISKTELARLTDPNAGTPLVSRAVQGQFAPGSTFKLSSASAEVMSGRAPLSGTYSCPGSLKVGNTTKNNFEGQRHRRLHQPADRAGQVVRHDLLRLRPDRLVRRRGPHRRAREAGREPAADGPGVRVRLAAGHRPAGRGADLRADRRPGVQADPLGREQGDVLRGRQARLPRGDRPGPALRS